MTSENSFVHAIAMVESTDNPNVVLGDHGRAAGRFQQHPSFYASWGPKPAEMHGEMTWDACFELALRKFWRAAPAGKAPADVAVAYHLHGQHVYTDDCPAYRESFLKFYG